MTRTATVASASAAVPTVSATAAKICHHPVASTPDMTSFFQVGKEETFMDSIKREIAIMKKVHHPNVLRLYEVMDDPKVTRT